MSSWPGCNKRHLGRYVQQSALATLALASLLLAVVTGTAQASYVRSAKFAIDAGVAGLAVDQSAGPFSGDVYTAAGFAFNPPNSEVNRYAAPVSAESSPSATFDSGTRFSGVAVNPSTGNVYALAYEQGVVDEFNPADPDTRSEEGAAVPAVPIATIGAGTIVPATGFNPGYNVRIWVNAAGEVFVPSPTQNVVYVFDASGKLSGEIGTGTPHEPTAVATDTNGNVYVVDKTPPASEGEASTGRVQEFSPAGTLDGTVGQAVVASAQGVTVNTATNEVIISDDRENEGETQIDAFEASPETSPGIFTPGGLRLRSILGYGLGPSILGIGVNQASGEVYVAPYGLFGEPASIFIAAEGPKAATFGCEEATATDATVTGQVDPNGFDTHWHVEYGLTGTYGKSSPAPPGEDAGEEPGARPVQTRLSGLQPDETYHYQFVAENLNGVAEGGDRTCTTLAVPPSVTGEPVSATGQTAATVHAQINPNNEETHYYFEYGTSTSYTLGNVPASPGQNIGSAYGDQSAQATLTGLQPNSLYHYRVVAANASGATDGVDHTFTTLPNPPAVDTEAASALGQDAATLNGTIDPQGAPASYYFEYSGPGTLSVVRGEVGPTSGAVTVTAAIQGLSPNVIYSYRLVVTSAGGTIYGAYQSFATQPSLAGPPGVTTGTAYIVGPGAAQLEGTVDPGGAPTRYHFDYGTSSSYGASAPVADGAISSGSNAQTVSVALTSLSPGVTYHYRLVAANANGPAYGDDESFTTPAATISTFGPPPENTLDLIASGTKAAPKRTTRAQKRAAMLKACKKIRRRVKRVRCENAAKKRYGATRPESKSRGQRVQRHGGPT